MLPSPSPPSSTRRPFSTSLLPVNLSLPVVVAFTIAVSVCNAACRDPVRSCDAGRNYFPDKASFQFATETLPAVKYENAFVDVDVASPDFGITAAYRLVKCGCEKVAPKPSGGRVAISIPPSAVYVGDTVIMAMLTANIAAANAIRAVSDVSNVYSPAIRRLVDSGQIVSVKDPKELAALQDEIDVAFVGSSDLDKFKNASLSISAFLVAEVAEPSPLGRAEWIKLFGLMFDQVLQTSSAFDNIQYRYETIRDRAFAVQRRPSVLVNTPFTDNTGTTWPQPSGSQYTAQFLRDANVDYRFHGVRAPGALFLTLDQVVGNFSSARYWINMGRFPAIKNDTIDALVSAGEFSEPSRNSFKKLAAVKCGNVWSQTNKITKDGQANDYFEGGVLRPDLILSDMLKIFHPGVSTSASSNPDDINYYYSLGMPSGSDIGPCPYNTLPDKPGKGKKFVASEFQVKGADRFQIEDKIPSAIAPAVANAANVTENDIEIYFSRPQKENASEAFVNVNTMVADTDADTFDEDKVAAAMQRSLGEDVTVTPISSKVSGSGSGSSGLNAGATAGIVLGSLASLALVAALSCVLAARSGKQRGYKEVKDKFWEEHGVRLAEDTNQRTDGSH